MFEKYRNILPGQLNPELTPKIGTPIARPSNITDDASAVHRKTMSNLVAPNVFEGVTTFRAIVLCPYLEDGTPFTELSNHSAGDSISLRCMIPELHLGLPNPFSARDLDEFKEISSTFYPIYGVPESRKKTEFEPVPRRGSIVEVRFDDPNKSIGYAVTVAKRVDGDNPDAEFPTSRDALVDGILATTTSQTEFPASTRTMNATTEEIQDAYPAAGAEMADAIVSVAEHHGMDPAHLANLIAGESNGTFDPAVQNPPGCVESGARACAVGPIQIIRSTAAKLGTNVEDLSRMSKVEYMDYVKQYFELNKDRGDGQGYGSQDRINMAVFHPDAIGGGASYDIYSDWVQKHGPEKAEEIFAANHGIQTAGDYYDIVSRKWEFEP